MKVTFLGHSAFLFSQDNLSVLIDPFLKENPLRTGLNYDVKADYILVSHGHRDHLGDTVELALKYNSKVISVFEISNYLTSKGLNNLVPMNIGGQLRTEFGYVKMVMAVHSSSIPDGESVINGGVPAGFIINFFGKTIYFAGDTALFGDMKLIGDLYNIDIALLPIGGHFTMDTKDALCAIDMLRPKLVIPMHFNTWPVINADVDSFLKESENKGVKGVCLDVDESIEI
ncbi:metal-dependent hydrolase [Deferribacterales bacterium Es71-Z0220]|uniref:metal-dependent hydrolase n=1 Tax=Deferrivibrio essentukiensis TaxID=2880922 RepID=UPI001F605515|nr:metal-dependent hydrolase [Deferrivibrio essentukiensis]MCB4203904.1 metal-dependent hydrolase [Deferrivibrio essentukiensis]